MQVNPEGKENPQMEEWIDTILKIAGLLDAMFFLAYTIQKIIDLFRGGRNGKS